MKKSNHVRSHPVSRTESRMQVKPTFFLAAVLIIAVYVFLTPIPAFATNDALDSSADTNVVADDGAQLETSTEDVAPVGKDSSPEEDSVTPPLEEAMPTAWTDCIILDQDGNYVDDLDGISKDADSAARIYTVNCDFYVTGRDYLDATLTILRPSSNAELWPSYKLKEFIFRFKSLENDMGSAKREMKNKYEGTGGDEAIYIRTIPNSTYLITPSQPDGLLLSDRDLARRNIGVLIGVSKLDGNILAGRENLCTVSFQFAVSTDEAALTKLKVPQASASASPQESETGDASNGVGVTAAPTSVTGLGHQGVVTTVILLIIGVELTALLIMLPMMMRANKRETLAGLKRIDSYLSTPRANGCTHCANQEDATDTHTPTPPAQQNFVAEEVGEPGNCVAPQSTNHEQP